MATTPIKFADLATWDDVRTKTIFPLIDRQDILVTDVSTLKTDMSAIQANATTFSSDISACKTDIQTLQGGQQVLEANINQKISGIHVEDVDNNAFDDINDLHFIGAVVEDVQGQSASIRITPKITVADGQGLDAKSMTTDVVIFPQGKVTPNDRDPKIANVTFDFSNSGSTFPPVVVDGTTYTYKSLEFDDFSAAKVGDKLVLTAPSVPVSGSGIEIDNNTSNLAGVTKLNFPTSEFVARSPKEVDIIPYVRVAEFGDTPKSASSLQMLPPLKVQDNSGDQYLQEVYIDNRAFEPQHAASCLLQLDSDLTLQVGKATKLYTPHEIVPTGEYYSFNKQAGGVNVQDNTGGDTAATGGELTRIMCSVGFYGKATEECNVKLWLWYKDPASPLAGGILEDVNGHPMVVEKTFNVGDDLSVPLFLAGAMKATGSSPIVVYVETSAGSFVVNPEQTLLCVEQFSDGYETSIAAIEMQRRLGIESHAEITHFTTEMLSLKEEIDSLDLQTTTIPANEGYDFLNEFGLQNLTPINASVSNSALNLSDTGAITDFYVDMYIDNAKTQMLRGKEIDYSAIIKAPYDAYVLALYKWTGKADRASRLYDSRNNLSLILNEGYTLVKEKFIQEQPSGNFFAATDTATIPEDANNLLIVIYPEEAQSPINLSIQDFSWGVPQPFDGYLETSRINLREQHLWFSENWAEFGLNNQGFASLRYTINNTADGNPMPVGKLLKGKAPVEIDNTVNQVPGSSDPQNDGAIKFLKDGEASISKTYLVRNEQGSDNTVTFWDVLIDVAGNETKIPDSEKTFNVPKNTGAPGIYLTIPSYVVEVETGQRIGSRASSSATDGAYIQSDAHAQLMVQTTIDFKELVPYSSDDPWAGVDFTSFDKTYTQPIFAEKIVSGTQTYSFTLDIPAGGTFDILNVLGSVDGTYNTISPQEYSFSWDSATRTATVDFKRSGDYRIFFVMMLP